MEFFELFVFEVEEHDLEHLLLALVAARLAVLEGTQGRDHDLLADRLEDRLRLQAVSVFDKVGHPSIIIIPISSIPYLATTIPSFHYHQSIIPSITAIIHPHRAHCMQLNTPFMSIQHPYL